MNILFKGDTLKIADYGTSELSQDSMSLRSLKPGGYTPAYAAPEQFDDGAHEKSDVWALGIIIYELLSGTGNRPFCGSRMQMAMAAENKPHDPPTCLDGLVPPNALLTLMDRCLEKERDDRPKAEECLAILTQIEKVIEDRGYFSECLGEIDPINLLASGDHRRSRPPVNQWELLRSHFLFFSTALILY